MDWQMVLIEMRIILEIYPVSSAPLRPTEELGAVWRE